MDFIDQLLDYLTSSEDVTPNTATTLYELMVP